MGGATDLFFFFKKKVNKLNKKKTALNVLGTGGGVERRNHAAEAEEPLLSIYIYR